MYCCTCTCTLYACILQYAAVLHQSILPSHSSPLPSLHWPTLQVLRNQEMRVKFPDLPEKFMESELELNEELQSLHVIATTPEYYSILMEVQHPPPTCVCMPLGLEPLVHCVDCHCVYSKDGRVAHKSTHLSDLCLEKDASAALRCLHE